MSVSLFLHLAVRKNAINILVTKNLGIWRTSAEKITKPTNMC